MAEIIPFVPALVNASEGKQALLSYADISLGGFFMLNDFFSSPAGTISIGIVLIGFICIFILNLKKKKSLSVKTLAYSAICLALAVSLSTVKLFTMPYGGAVTACSMLFVTLIGYWFGISAGILAAVTFGLLKLILGAYIIHPLQLLLDYPIAFGALGLSGIFRNSKYGLQKGYVLGTSARWFFSTLSGIIFFSSYAGDMSPIAYSALYNFFYIAPEMGITLLILSIPSFGKAIDTVKNMAGDQKLIS